MSAERREVVRRVEASARQVEVQVEQVPVPLVPHLTVGALVRELMGQIRHDRVAAFAGNLTYNAFLAIFPFLLLLISLLKVIHAKGLIVRLVDTMARSLPSSAAHLVRHQILPDALSRLTTNPLLSVLLALGSLWAVSAVARAAIGAMNDVYGVHDRRPLWLRFALSIGLSLVAALLFLTALGILILGPVLIKTVDHAVGLGVGFDWVWSTIQWPLLIALVALAFALIYLYGPDSSQPLALVLPGTAVATVAWLVFSIGFTVVLNNFSQSLISPLYGWFTGLIILLMYMYWSSLIVLVGAEVNQVVGSRFQPGVKPPRK